MTTSVFRGDFELARRLASFDQERTVMRESAVCEKTNNDRATLNLDHAGALLGKVVSIATHPTQMK